MRKKILIGGEWREAGETVEVRSPFTNELLAEVASADAADLETAVAAAEKAARQMRNLPRYEIAAGLRKIAEGIEARKREFGETIAREAAKPIKTALGEVERGIATFRWAAGEAERLAGEAVPLDTIETGKGKTGFTKRVPRGVIYGITPFNFPLNLVGHKVAPALASGNSIIIKPSEKTPLTALLLGEVFLESGLPPAALQIVPMSVEHIDPVYEDERIKMISFTGSAEVGWKIKSRAGKKMVTLELGGNAPVIVDETADLEHSVARSALGAFTYSGQVCISVQRLLLHEKIADRFTEKFIEKAANLKTGDPLDEATEMSVMIEEKAAARAESWIKEATDNGAEILCGGARRGAMLDATVLTGTSPEMRVVAEEVFAPVAVIEKFSDFEEAVERANQTRYGLQAGVFTGRLERSLYAADHLEYGGVVINDVPTFRVDNMPYGGVKDSGFGREGVRYAMDEMTEIRLVVINS
jgi:acyl-CoA reductase-like NAD-dependent aldehyde dehydrogenase